MQNQIPSIVLALVAVGLFVFASGLTESPAAEKTVAEKKPVGAAPVPSTSQAAPAAVAAAAPKPSPGADTLVTPTRPEKPNPPVAAPRPVAKPAVRPTPAKAPTPAPAPPASITGVNQDDQPEKRTKSGKVEASTDINRPPAYGPTGAPVHVIVFSDFQCPVCKRAVEATHQIAEEFPGEVRLEFWQHALKMHPNAEIAAAASLAAHQQGKFWPMHDKLFENQRALDENSLMTYAEGLGLDMETFRKDFADPELRKVIASQGDFARAMGARGTPAFLINGKSSVGWGSWNGFRGQVLREVNKAKDLKKAGKTAAEIREARAKENAENAEAFQRILNEALVPLAGS